MATKKVDQKKESVTPPIIIIDQTIKNEHHFQIKSMTANGFYWAWIKIFLTLAFSIFGYQNFTNGQWLWLALDVALLIIILRSTRN